MWLAQAVHARGIRAGSLPLSRLYGSTWKFQIVEAKASVLVCQSDRGFGLLSLSLYRLACRRALLVSGSVSTVAHEGTPKEGYPKTAHLE